MSWIKSIKRVFGLSRSDIEMMSCQEVMDVLYEYIDDELDEVTRLRVKGHMDMGQCECERALLFEIAFLKKVRGSLTSEPVPEDLRQRIIDRLVD